MSTLLTYFLFCASMSLVAVGGASTVLPAVHNEVLTHNWLSDVDFVQIVTLGQVTPGPNVMYLALIGWVLGGPLGTFLGLAGFIFPSAIFAIIAGRMLRHHKAHPRVRALRLSMRPIASGAFSGAGLLLAWAFARERPLDTFITIAVVLVASRTKIGALPCIAVAAVIGAFAH